MPGAGLGERGQGAEGPVRLTGERESELVTRGARKEGTSVSERVEQSSTGAGGQHESHQLNPLLLRLPPRSANAPVPWATTLPALLGEVVVLVCLRWIRIPTKTWSFHPLSARLGRPETTKPRELHGGDLVIPGGAWISQSAARCGAQSTAVCQWLETLQGACRSNDARRHPVWRRTGCRACLDAVLWSLPLGPAVVLGASAGLAAVLGRPLLGSHGWRAEPGGLGLLLKVEWRN